MTIYFTYIQVHYLLKSTFPEIWRNLIIIPIPKCSNEYRPKAILRFIRKVGETLIHEQIWKKLSTNFQTWHCCITVRLNVTKDIRVDIDLTVLTIFDFAKINHYALFFMQKLLIIFLKLLFIFQILTFPKHLKQFIFLKHSSQRVSNII